jgi:hypothetical protein
VVAKVATYKGRVTEGNDGWPCPGCGLPQPTGTNIYVLYGEKNRWLGFYCVDCTRGYGLIW